MRTGNNESKLDDYVSKQLEGYYGKDVVRSVERSAPPPSSAHKRRPRALSFAAVICAVVFLLGASMFAGVLFSGGIPTAGHNQGEISVNSEENSYAVSSKDSVDSTENSSAVSSKDSVDSTENSSAVSSKNHVSSAEDSSAVSSKEYVSSTENSSAVSSKDSVDSAENSSAVSSKNYVSSAENSSWRIDSFSLPDIPSESGYVVETDPDNNSLTNPYDNVTTGRRARAGLGIFLMLASLCSAAALYNLYTDEEINKNDRT